MKIKIVHISDLELNPTFQTAKYTNLWKSYLKAKNKDPGLSLSDFYEVYSKKNSEAGKELAKALQNNPDLTNGDVEKGTPNEKVKHTTPWLTLQEKKKKIKNFKEKSWDWLFGSMNQLLDRVIINRGDDQQLLLISGDVVKGGGRKKYWKALHKKLCEVSESGTQIILTTGSHDTMAIRNGKPFDSFYYSKPFNSHPGHPDAPWIVVDNPFGERIDLCNDEISIIGYGDLDGTKNQTRINAGKYAVGRSYWSGQRERLSPRFVIGMSADHYPRIPMWALDNIYCYIATGGTEGHRATLGYDSERDEGLCKVNDHFVGSRQGRPFRCVGFGNPRWEWLPLSFTYGIVNPGAEPRTATFKELAAHTEDFNIVGGFEITY